MSLHNKQNGSAHIIIIGALALVVIAAAGTLVATRGQSKNSIKDSVKISTHHSIVTDPKRVLSMLADAKAGKYDLKCSFDTSSVASQAPLRMTSGTFFFSGASKRRVDGLLTSQTATKSAHVVQDASWTYIWTEGATEGSKAPVTQSTDSDTLSSKFAAHPEDYKLACQNVGHLSSSLFVPPPNVHFTDLNQSIKAQNYSSGQ